MLVSGDLYDRALPPVDAVALCDEALRRLAAEKVQVIVISGNHDSAQRLGFGAGLIDAAGVHVRADPRSVGAPGPARRRHGASTASPTWSPRSSAAGGSCPSAATPPR